jgi:hypothetical protein
MPPGGSAAPLGKIYQQQNRRAQCRPCKEDTGLPKAPEFDYEVPF